MRLPSTAKPSLSGTGPRLRQSTLSTASSTTPRYRCLVHVRSAFPRALRPGATGQSGLRHRLGRRLRTCPRQQTRTRRLEADAHRVPARRHHVPASPTGDSRARDQNRDRDAPWREPRLGMAQRDWPECALGIFTGDSGLHSHELRDAVRARLFVENIYEASHATERASTARDVTNRNNAIWPIADYPGWEANGHGEVRCRCKGPVLATERTSGSAPTAARGCP